MDREQNQIDVRLEEKLGFDRVRGFVSHFCATDYAKGRTASETFCTDGEEILHRLLPVDEMKMILMFEDSFPRAGYVDCGGFLKGLEMPSSHIDLPSLGRLRTMLETIGGILGFFGSLKDGVYPNLKKMSRHILPFPEVRRRIDRIIDRFGEVRDDASEELLSIRRSLREMENSVSRRIAAVLRRAQEEGIVEKDASVSVRDGKTLIPVPAVNKRKINGYVFDESATGKTVFVEPAEIIELNNNIKELRFDEAREILRILTEFSDFLRPQVPDLLNAAEFMGELDFIMAKANTALDIIAGMPVLSESGEMRLMKARHPILEKALRRENKEIVPQSVILNPRKHILIISGPNAGGKTVCLKTVGLLQYMFQWGMLIPTSEISEMVVFDRILVSIGDDQSLENDLSTYSSFLADMRGMLASADERTLVLLDEFGSGTEPAAGGAIAEALLAELDRRGVYAVITTHYTNLKLYASGENTGAVNGAMMFDAKNIEPLFKLEMGLPGNSFAFELARKMGLPEGVLKDAEARAGEEFVGIERNLRKIARSRKSLDERLEKIRHTDKALEGITEKYRKELAEIKSLRKEVLEKARREAEEIVSGANRQVENTIRVIRESQAEKAATAKARQELSGFVEALSARKDGGDDYIDRKIKQLDERKARADSKAAARAARNGSGGSEVGSGRDGSEAEVTGSGRSGRGGSEVVDGGPLKVGDKVRILSNGMVGEVAKTAAKSVTVNVGNISSRLSPDMVERISSNEYRQSMRAAASASGRSSVQLGGSISQRKLNFHPEIDVRGERLDDAIDKVVRFVDDAIMLDVGTVRIIHGKGTGVLHEELQKLLRTIPGVASVADEHIQHGGSGVTVVTFE
ncbi:MAG: Smr/MutS family protein [Bacteroidales bacterium]|nr:Smr/MutS family protein [Bacteroidales bacterium]